jgi:hypothetical protein
LLVALLVGQHLPVCITVRIQVCWLQQVGICLQLLLLLLLLPLVY